MRRVTARCRAQVIWHRTRRSDARGAQGVSNAPPPVALAFMNGGVPAGQAVVLDVAQLQALLSNTFNLGLVSGAFGRTRIGEMGEDPGVAR